MGTKSEMVAQVEAQVHVCVVVGGLAKDSGLEKRNGSAGRGNPSNGRLVLHREWAS